MDNDLRCKQNFEIVSETEIEEAKFPSQKHLALVQVTEKGNISFAITSAEKGQCGHVSL